MPRQRSDNTEAVNLKIPLAWIEMADALAKTGDMPAEVSRTGVLRAALGFGLQALAREHAKRIARHAKRKVAKRKRANGSNGIRLAAKAVRVGEGAPKGKEQDDDGAAHGKDRTH